MHKPNEKNDPDIDWKDLSFRCRSRISGSSGNDPRFAIALGVFVLVALLFPWYAYEVVSYSLERDATKALNSFGIETQKQMDEANEESQRQSAVVKAQKLAQRIVSVRVMGVSSGGNLPTVLVALGNSNIYEAQDTICQQAGVWLRKDVSGTSIKVQSHRGNRPAVDAGVIECP